MRMNWRNLLCEDRERLSKTIVEEHRNAFDMDYERIVCSSSIRRLQDKAQVFPLQENDFTRTRLTHSMEVSSIARSIGRNIEEWLIKEKKDKYEKRGMLPSLLAVAGLVHDLGNPPFGHAGEEAIKEWFTLKKEKYKNLDGMQDFFHFDGNPQTFRILTRLQFLNDRYGANFSFGTLSTLMKYPWSSDDEEAKKKSKFGFMNSEKDLAEKIKKAVGMINRHPATYLLEAADDISYLFADLEDTIKKRPLLFYVFFKELKEELKKIEDQSKCWNGFIEKIEEAINRNKEKNVSLNELQINGIAFLKVVAQGIVIGIVCEEFKKNYDLIMEGKYQSELLKNKDLKDVVKFIKKFTITYGYRCKEVISLELTGKCVIFSLLDSFISNVNDYLLSNKTDKSKGKYYELISENFKYIHYLDEESNYDSNIKFNEYKASQMVVDFISGMTDSYALKLHRELSGIEI